MEKEKSQNQEGRHRQKEPGDGQHLCPPQLAGDRKGMRSGGQLYRRGDHCR